MKVHLWALVAVCCIAVTLADPELRDDDTLRPTFLSDDVLRELPSGLKKELVAPKEMEFSVEQITRGPAPLEVPSGMHTVPMRFQEVKQKQKQKQSETEKGNVVPITHVHEKSAPKKTHEKAKSHTASSHPIGREYSDPTDPDRVYDRQAVPENERPGFRQRMNARVKAEDEQAMRMAADTPAVQTPGQLLDAQDPTVPHQQVGAPSVPQFPYQAGPDMSKEAFNPYVASSMVQNPFLQGQQPSAAAPPRFQQVANKAPAVPPFAQSQHLAHLAASIRFARAERMKQRKALNGRLQETPQAPQPAGMPPTLPSNGPPTLLAENSAAVPASQSAQLQAKAPPTMPDLPAPPNPDSEVSLIETKNKIKAHTAAKAHTATKARVSLGVQTALKDREMLNDGQAMAANLASHVAQRSSGTPPTAMRGTAAQNGLPSPPPLAAGPHPQQVQRKAMPVTNYAAIEQRHVFG